MFFVESVAATGLPSAIKAGVQLLQGPWGFFATVHIANRLEKFMSFFIVFWEIANGKTTILRFLDHCLINAVIIGLHVLLYGSIYSLFRHILYIFLLPSNQIT